MGCGLQRWMSREVLHLLPAIVPLCSVNQNHHFQRNRKCEALINNNYNPLRRHTLKRSQEGEFKLDNLSAMQHAVKTKSAAFQVKAANVFTSRVTRHFRRKTP